MSIAWLVPAALAGIGLIVLPIAVHLLVRQSARRLPFPSLRFLQETQLAALRRRTIQDAALLLCRSAIVAAAAIALAGPVFQTRARTAGFAARTSRAIVKVGAVDDSAVATVREGAFRSGVFARARPGDSLADATRWLDQQPPSSREMVIAGALRRGDIDAADLATIPDAIGIRFLQLPSEPAADRVVSILTLRGGALTRVDRLVTMTSDATRVVDRGQSPVAGDLVRIVARPEDSDLANAALRAALGAGVPWTDFTTPVVVRWEGDAGATPAQARVIDMAVPKPASSAADAVFNALVRGVPQAALTEPMVIDRAQLDQWSRPAGPVSTDAPLADEGDRRWVWAAVLLLLAVEAGLRRSVNAQAASHEEARVA